jgi:hypothetical protein
MLFLPVLGSEDDHGNFLVQDCGLCYAGIPPPPPSHHVTGQLLFVSGLRLGGSSSDAGAGLLLEWLAGFCGSDSSNICACILLGNGCAFRLSVLIDHNILARIFSQLVFSSHDLFSEVAARQDARNLSLRHFLN